MHRVIFDLQPWELVGKEMECEGEEDFNFDVVGETFQVRCVNSQQDLLTYFRFLDAPEEHFVVAHPSNYKPRLGLLSVQPRGYRSLLKENEFKEEFLRVFELNIWGRLFLLKADLGLIEDKSEISQAEWKVFVLANGTGAFSHLLRRAASVVF